MSSKAAFVKTNPLLNPAVRITRVVPTPAKKTTAFEALGIFLLYNYERTGAAYVSHRERMAIQMGCVEFRCRKTLPRDTRQGHAESRRTRKAGTLVVRRGLRGLRDRRSVFRANLHRLHAGFGFGPGLEHAVVNDGRCGGRLLVDNGTFLRRRIPHDIVLASKPWSAQRPK